METVLLPYPVHNEQECIKALDMYTKNFIGIEPIKIEIDVNKYNIESTTLVYEESNYKFEAKFFSNEMELICTIKYQKK